MPELQAAEYRALVKEMVERIAAGLSGAAAAPAVSPVSSANTVAGVIEHTLLNPGATMAQVEALCAEAAHWRFAGVCVNPTWVPLAAAALRSTPVLVVTVIGFPLGATLGSVKRHEAAECLKLGADELDMVLNIGALKSGNDGWVREDIRGVADVAHAAGAQLKVILETALLSDEEKVRACRLAQAAGADCVKTSTGFASGGATVEDVALMRATVGDDMCLKAAGGVRSLAELQAMVAAGATRIGTSSGVKIMEQLHGAPAPDAAGTSKSY